MSWLRVVYCSALRRLCHGFAWGCFVLCLSSFVVVYCCMYWRVLYMCLCGVVGLFVLWPCCARGVLHGCALVACLVALVIAVVCVVICSVLRWFMFAL